MCCDVNTAVVRFYDWLNECPLLHVRLPVHTHTHTHTHTRQEIEGKPSDEESSSDESDQETWREIRRERKQVAAANVQTPVVSDTSQKQLASAGSKLTMVPGSVAVLKKPSK